jgi:hypothetical protein
MGGNNSRMRYETLIVGYNNVSRKAFESVRDLVSPDE